jgi:general secretion pathway protein N
MRPVLAVATAAVLLFAALLVTAPAALFDARVAALSAGHLRLVNTDGTIWNGSGELVLLPAGTRQPLRWRLDAWPLLGGEVRAQIASEAAGVPDATVVYGRDHLELRALEFALPVESIVPLATSAKLALGGTLLVHVDHLVWLGNALDAQLTAQWRDASLPGPRPDARIALGDVRIDLSGHGSELSGPVRNAGGEVEITGQVALAAAGASSVELVLRPRGSERGRVDPLTATLATLGVPDGQGGYHVHWSGAWR